MYIRGLQILLFDIGYWFYQGELEEPTFNYYINTVEEFKSPLLNKDSVVHQEGLRLVSLETQTEPCFYQEKLKTCGASGTYIISFNFNPTTFKSKHRANSYKNTIYACISFNDKSKLILRPNILFYYKKMIFNNNYSKHIFHGYGI